MGEDLPAALFSVVAIKLGAFMTMAGGDWAGDRWTDHYLPGYKEVSSTLSGVVDRDGERWLPRKTSNICSTNTLTDHGALTRSTQRLKWLA